MRGVRRRVGDAGVSWIAGAVKVMSREEVKVAREKDVQSGGDRDGWSRCVPRVGVVEVKMEVDGGSRPARCVRLSQN
jgi:hypothetical protein